MKNLLLNRPLLIFLLLVCSDTINSDEFPKSPEEYQEKLIEYFSNIHSSQVIYFAVEQARPFLRQEQIDSYSEQEMTLSNFLRKMKAKQLTDEEANLVDGLSEEDVENKIKTIQVFKKNEPLDTLRVYSAKGFQFKIDVKRLSVSDNDYSFQYNGQVGVYNHPATTRYASGSFITNQWTNYVSFVRFGSGLEQIQKRFPSIVDVNPERRSITLSVYIDNRIYPTRIEFVTLDDNPFYWKECIHWDREGTNWYRRVVCGDFKDFSGLKVPQVVRQFSKCKVNGNFIDRETLYMTLVEVKVNDECDFPEDFFDIKPDWVQICQKMNRQ